MRMTYIHSLVPRFSLLLRNNLRMTFDPPERAEGEPGPFSHVIATRILRKGDTFLRESSVEARNRNAGYAIRSRIAEWQEDKKSAEDARARRVERTSSIHDIAELPQRARTAVGVGEMTEFVVHTSGHGYITHVYLCCLLL